MTPERRERLQRVLDAVDERHDASEAGVTLTWGELRYLLALAEDEEHRQVGDG